MYMIIRVHVSYMMIYMELDASANLDWPKVLRMLDVECAFKKSLVKLLSALWRYNNINDGVNSGLRIEKNKFKKSSYLSSQSVRLHPRISRMHYTRTDSLG